MMFNFEDYSGYIGKISEFGISLKYGLKKNFG